MYNSFYTQEYFDTRTTPTPPQNSTIGRCSDCTNFNENYGKYGFFLSVRNCSCPTATPDENCTCDITVNYYDKRQECPSSFSLLECLYDNPTQNGGKTFYDGVDITNTLNRDHIPPIEGGPPIPPPLDPNGYINDGRAINSGELMKLVQRLILPCGSGVGDFYQNPQEPGCLPYSGVSISNQLGVNICNDGESLGIDTCCGGDLTCENTKINDCNPCTGIIQEAPVNEEKWRDDICHYYCPSYWTQRQYLQRLGFFNSDEQLCSDTYKVLCDLMGCETDNACKIKWGGCSTYTEIDLDICNGGVWNREYLNPGYVPENKCADNPPSEYCTTEGLCLGNPNYSRNCKNDPWATPEILPTVIKKN